ncbi:MAG TPA: ABC transporter permease [Chloroflexota bacterium]|nr:ABC transporter permease [Chloroflexota bacterium]
MSSSSSRAVAAQTQMELTLTMRRGENVLVTVIIPVVLLVFFASLNVIPSGTSSGLDYLVPGILALAIISTGMVNLGIATAYERYYGVLKRLGGSPLPQWGLLVAKALAVLALEVFQIVLLYAVAHFGYGWQPHVQAPLALAAIILGTIAFCALGLAMAGGLRAEATLAIANGLYLLFLLLGDIVLPLDHLPALLRPVASVLPATALSETLRAAFVPGATTSSSSLLALLAWAVVASVLAIRAFRWE